MDGIEEDRGMNEFFNKWEMLEYSPLLICSECKLERQGHRYRNRETGDENNLCLECVWYFVELTAEYLKMESML